MGLDSRTWLLWGSAVSVPVLVSRNPFLLVELLVIVLVVRSLSPAAHDWAWIVRIVAIFMLIGVLFNLLTVHSGDQVIGSLPEGWPIVGGVITWNALAYGVVSGLAIFLLVLTWTLVASNLRWNSLVRHLPPRFAPLAVAGSVAWSYLPQMRDTLREIRESQRSRGWQPGRIRDLPAIIVPLLAGGLERSLVTAEVLEARGFGGPPSPGKRSLAASLFLLAAVIAIVSGLYCLLVGQSLAGAMLGVVGIALLTAELRRTPLTVPPTRLRDESWTPSDTGCTVASLATMLIVGVRLVMAPQGVEFNPYPVMDVPDVDPILMAALLLLFAPALAPPAATT